MGASFSNNSTSNVPSVVSKTSMDGCFPSGGGPLGFGNALVAGEIAVRGYRSEATGDKRRAHRGSLGCAVFEQQPASRCEMPGGAIYKSGERVEAVTARGERSARLEPQAVARENRIVGGDVRGIARDGIEAAAGERREPAGGVVRNPLDAAGRESLAVAPRHGQRG